MLFGAALIPAALGALSYAVLALGCRTRPRLPKAALVGIAVASLHLVLLGLGWVVEGSLRAYSTNIVASGLGAAAFVTKRGAR